MTVTLFMGVGRVLQWTVESYARSSLLMAMNLIYFRIAIFYTVCYARRHDFKNFLLQTEKGFVNIFLKKECNDDDWSTFIRKGDLSANWDGKRNKHEDKDLHFHLLNISEVRTQAQEICSDHL